MVQPRHRPSLKMLIDFSNKILNQLLLGCHSLDQFLELGGRNRGLNGSRSDGSWGDRSGSGSDSDDSAPRKDSN